MSSSPKARATTNCRFSDTTVGREYSCFQIWYKRALQNIQVIPALESRFCEVIATSFCRCNRIYSTKYDGGSTAEIERNPPFLNRLDDIFHSARFLPAISTRVRLWQDLIRWQIASIPLISRTLDTSYLVLHYKYTPDETHSGEIDTSLISNSPTNLHTWDFNDSYLNLDAFAFLFVPHVGLMNLTPAG